MNSTFKLTRLLTGIALGVLTAASPAQASDAKTISGSACFPFAEGTSGLWIRIGPGAYNAGSESVFVVCPVVRDNTGNTNGIRDIELQVSLPSSSSMECTAGSYDASGFGTIKAVGKKTSVAGNSKMDWGSSVNASSVNGTYAIYCSVPPLGTIYSIRHDEY
jgi:hypothetical protein